MIIKFHQTELQRGDVLQRITDHERINFQSNLDEIYKKIHRRPKYTTENILFMVLKHLNMLIPIFPMMCDLSAISR